MVVNVDGGGVDNHGGDLILSQSFYTCSIIKIL